MLGRYFVKGKQIMERQCRRSLKRFVCAVSMLSMMLSIAALAQMGMTGQDMGAMAPVPAPESLPAPLRMTGLGNSHMAITTTSPEAQMWFDQGLNELHDFWDYESERSFEQAVRVDPSCAMCYWGLAEALGFRGGQDAYASIARKQADKLKGNASKTEQLFIKALVQENAGKDKKAQADFRKILKAEPDNIQANIFLAESLRNGYTDAGEPKPGTQAAIDLLANVLKEHPDDSAANHYWIHAMEPSNHPERAIESAKRLASEAPASGHMVHMPGHIFYRVGDYAGAEPWFARSTAVDEAYMKAQHVGVDNDWNYVHNLMYRIANLMEEGKFTEAKALSAKLTAARGQYSATLYVYSPRDSMARLNNGLPIALRQGDWTAVLTMLSDTQSDAKPDAQLANLEFLAGQLREFATGMKAVEAKDVATAENSAKKLDEQLAAEKAKPSAAPVKQKKLKPGMAVMQVVAPDATLAPIVANLSIMALELRASILVAKKDVAGGKLLFTKAAKAEKDLGYREPPAFICPVDETEGDALLRAGDAVDAHAAFAASLVERPNSGMSLYGEAESSEAEGNTAKAITEYAAFLEAWKNSDPGLPEVVQAREFMEAHPVVAAL
jgi:tetratricopeptide (TPR) repeat protein